MSGYCIDTSALIDAGIRYYPPDVFPSFRKKLEMLLDSSRLKAPATLLDEITRKDDDLAKWVKANKDALIVPMDAAQQTAVTVILGQFPNLINAEQKPLNGRSVLRRPGANAKLDAGDRGEEQRQSEQAENSRRLRRPVDSLYQHS